MTPTAAIHWVVCFIQLGLGFCQSCSFDSEELVPDEDVAFFGISDYSLEGLSTTTRGNSERIVRYTRTTPPADYEFGETYSRRVIEDVMPEIFVGAIVSLILVIWSVGVTCGLCHTVALSRDCWKTVFKIISLFIFVGAVCIVYFVVETDEDLLDGFDSSGKGYSYSREWIDGASTMASTLNNVSKSAMVSLSNISLDGGTNAEGTLALSILTSTLEDFNRINQSAAVIASEYESLNSIITGHDDDNEEFEQWYTDYGRGLVYFITVFTILNAILLICGTIMAERTYENCYSFEAPKMRKCMNVWIFFVVLLIPLTWLLAAVIHYYSIMYADVCLDPSLYLEIRGVTGYPSLFVSCGGLSDAEVGSNSLKANMGDIQDSLATSAVRLERLISQTFLSCSQKAELREVEVERLTMEYIFANGSETDGLSSHVNCNQTFTGFYALRNAACDGVFDPVSRMFELMLAVAITLSLIEVFRRFAMAIPAIVVNEKQQTSSWAFTEMNRQHSMRSAAVSPEWDNELVVTRDQDDANMPRVASYYDKENSSRVASYTNPHYPDLR